MINEKIVFYWNPQVVVQMGLCPFMQKWKDLDVEIICENYVFYAHKQLLVARSPYLKEEIQKYAEVSQIIIQVPGLIMKSILEFIYTGTTTPILIKNFQLTMFIGKVLKLPGFKNYNLETDYSPRIPRAIFLRKKRKYRDTYGEASTNLGPTVPTEDNNYKVKRPKTNFEDKEIQDPIDRESAKLKLTINNNFRKLLERGTSGTTNEYEEKPSNVPL